LVGVISLQFTCRGRAHRNSFTDIAKTTLHHHQEQKMTFASATTCKLLYIHDPSARFEVVYIIGDVCTPFPKHDSSEKPTHRLGPNTRNTYQNLTSNANFDNVVNAFRARTGLVVVVRHARESRRRASPIVDMHMCKSRKKPMSQKARAWRTPELLFMS
jgi:hypothetical protein